MKLLPGDFLRQLTSFLPACFLTKVVRSGQTNAGMGTTKEAEAEAEAAGPFFGTPKTPFAIATGNTNLAKAAILIGTFGVLGKARRIYFRCIARRWAP